MPGHDPLVRARYPAPSPELEGIAVRLDVDPRELTLRGIQVHRPAQLRPVPGGEREQDQALDGEECDRAEAPSQSASTPT